jgi:hypothetical protein
VIRPRNSFDADLRFAILDGAYCRDLKAPAANFQSAKPALRTRKEEKKQVPFGKLRAGSRLGPKSSLGMTVSGRSSPCWDDKVEGLKVLARDNKVEEAEVLAQDECEREHAKGESREAFVRADLLR